jgi:MIP family channel proteins
VADEDKDPEKDVDKASGDEATEDDSSRATTTVLEAQGRRGDDIEERGPAAYVAEFIGTFFLVMFICGAAVLYAPGPIEANPATGQAAFQPFQDWSVIGMVHLFTLFFLIQALAVISGAHFNPAVTAALTGIRQIRPADAGIYVICQLAGGVLGALVIKLILKDEGDPGYGAPSFENSVASGSVGAGFAAELIGTFVLVWAIVGVAVHPRGLREWAGFAIGAPLGVSVMVLGPLSGGSFNPARAFGPSVVGEFVPPIGEWILVYVGAPVLGALAAGIIYFQMFILPGKKGAAGMGPVG